MLPKFICNLLRRSKSLKSSVSKDEHYIPPILDCSNSILLSGPAYGDKTFLGSFLLDVPLSKDWIKDHAKSVFSTFKLEQEARLFLPKWCDSVSNNCDSYVTLIDVYMRHVLVPYTYDFYNNGFLKIYCHQCKSYCKELLDNSSVVEKIGNERKLTEEWLCSNGHILHSKNQELRLLIRKKILSIS